MRSFALVVLLFFTAVLHPYASDLNAVRGGQGTSQECPTVDTTSIDSIEAGEPLTFTAQVSGGDPNVTPTFNWTVSAGFIESGQGTAVITVNTTEVPAQGTVTATVDIGGYDRSCTTSSSSTSYVLAKAEARKIDEFGEIPAKDEQARLDNLALELREDPTASGIILTYGGRKSRTDDAEKAAARAKDYLVSKRKIEHSRVVAMSGGYREELTIEIWVVPAGAESPEPSPTVDPAALKPTQPPKPQN
jgi:hypothetical protein